MGLLSLGAKPSPVTDVLSTFILHRTAEGMEYVREAIEALLLFTTNANKSWAINYIILKNFPNEVACVDTILGSGVNMGLDVFSDIPDNVPVKLRDRDRRTRSIPMRDLPAFKHVLSDPGLHATVADLDSIPMPPGYLDPDIAESLLPIIREQLGKREVGGGRSTLKTRSHKRRIGAKAESAKQKRRVNAGAGGGGWGAGLGAGVGGLDLDSDSDSGESVVVLDSDSGGLCAGWVFIRVRVLWFWIRIRMIWVEVEVQVGVQVEVRVGV
jgi:hypothetical protein